MPKTVKRGSLRFCNIHFYANFQKKIEGGPFGDFEKFSKKKQKMRIFNSLIVPKNLKYGTFWDFLTFDLLQINKKIEGRNLWGYLKNFEKKSHKADKGGVS